MAAESASGRSTPSGRRTRTVTPSTVPVTPTPGVAWTSVARSRPAAASRMAVAIGWSLSASTAAASSSTSDAVTPAAGVTSLTVAVRSVRVPVLSKTTVSTWASRSSASPLRMKIPRADARPDPAIMATGAARPMAHGHATSSRATPLNTAVPTLPTTSHQIRNVRNDAPRTRGTNTSLMRSATAWIGGRSRWASSTRRCNRASTDSEAMASTFVTSTPLPLRVPPVTVSPGDFSTGRGSPVSIDSSTDE